MVERPASVIEEGVFLAAKDAMIPGCSVCQYMENLSKDRILWEDNYWIGGALLDVPGWVMVMTKRHVEGIWALSDEEAVRFGPMMRDIAGALKDITGAERIHYAAMGEVAPHYHNAILPRLPGGKPVWDSMAMVARAQEDANPDASRTIEDMLRERLGSFRSNLAAAARQHAVRI